MADESRCSCMAGKSLTRVRGRRAAPRHRRGRGAGDFAHRTRAWQRISAISRFQTDRARSGGLDLWRHLPVHGRHGNGRGHPTHPICGWPGRVRGPGLPFRTAPPPAIHDAGMPEEETQTLAKRKMEMRRAGGRTHSVRPPDASAKSGGPRIERGRSRPLRSPA